MRAHRAAVAGALALAVLLGGSSALTASNGVASSNAGQGTGDVSGYTVTLVEYALATGVQGDQVTGVSFTVNQPAETVRARPVQGATPPGDYTTCTPVSGQTNRWTCTWTGGPVLVSSITKLDVVAVDSTS